MQNVSRDCLAGLSFMEREEWVRSRRAYPARSEGTTWNPRSRQCD
ncbi:hypothetical protein ACULNC_17285 [Shigella flexneri]